MLLKSITICGGSDTCGGAELNTRIRSLLSNGGTRVEIQMPDTYAGVVCKSCKTFIRIDELTGDQKDAYWPRPSYKQDLKCPQCGETAQYIADDIKVTDVDN